MVRFEWAVEKATEAWNVPRLVLQPIVENAFSMTELLEATGLAHVVAAVADTEQASAALWSDDGALTVDAGIRRRSTRG